MRHLALVPLLLCGCVPGSTGVPAPAGALACAERAASGMGYHVTARSEQTSFTAEKFISSTGAYREVGEVSVAFLSHPQRGGQLRVHASRYEDRGGTGAMPTAPGLGGGTGVGPGGVPEPAVAASTRGRRRVSPGLVAADAQSIQTQCGSGSAAQMAER